MDLNDVSTADFLDNRISAKNGPFYEIVKVLSHRLWRIFPLGDGSDSSLVSLTKEPNFRCKKAVP